MCVCVCLLTVEIILIDQGTATESCHILLLGQREYSKYFITVLCSFGIALTIVQAYCTEAHISFLVKNHQTEGWGTLFSSSIKSNGALFQDYTLVHSSDNWNLCTISVFVCWDEKQKSYLQASSGCVSHTGHALHISRACLYKTVLDTRRSACNYWIKAWWSLGGGVWLQNRHLLGELIAHSWYLRK